MPEDIQRELGAILNELRNIRDDLREIKLSTRQNAKDIEDLMQFKGLAYACARLVGLVVVGLPIVAVFR